MKKSYMEKAIAYSEEYGIIDFQVKGKQMIYYRNYFEDCQHKEKHTLKVVVDLDTLETTKTTLKRLNRAGDLNMCI